MSKPVAIAFIGLCLATLVRTYFLMRTGRVEWTSPIGAWRYDRKEAPLQFWGLAAAMILVCSILIAGVVYLAF